MPRLGDVPLDHDLVLPLELLEDEGAHDAVAHHQRQQPDVREEETAVANLILDVGNVTDVYVRGCVKSIPTPQPTWRDHAPLPKVNWSNTKFREESFLLFTF